MEVGVKRGDRCQEELEIDQEWIIEGLTADQIRNLDVTPT
jgi:hypothetical protein